jgi:hypothetical protein
MQDGGNHPGRIRASGLLLSDHMGPLKRMHKTRSLRRILLALLLKKKQAWIGGEHGGEQVGVH